MEQRRSHRATVDLKVSFPNLDVFLDSYIGNISSGGLLLQSEMAFAIGQKILVEFTISGIADIVRATCEVVWRQEIFDIDRDAFIPAYGCKFVEIDQKHLDAICMRVDKELAGR